MSDQNDQQLIGGGFCHAPLAPGLLPRQGQELTAYERGALWRLFQHIGLVWENLHPSATDSANLKSSWLEFIDAKTQQEPSYVAEYSNAVLVVDELIEIYGEQEAYKRLFLDNGIPEGPPVTRLAHAKKYVVDEFIRVNVVASGFRSFGPRGGRGRNYKGYIGGSRYNIHARVRHYEPTSGETK